MTNRFDAEPLEKLVALYSEAAGRHGRATETGDHKAANKAYEVLAACYREMRGRGPEALRALLPLLGDADLGVRVWAATHSLEFAPNLGEPILESAKVIQGSLIAFSAAMTLEEWRKGQLKFV